MTAPAHRFSLYLGTRFFVVEVHQNEAAMQQAIADLRGFAVPADREARAMILKYRAEGRSQTGRMIDTGELGTLFFHKDDLTPNVVLHELTHAALYWARRIRLNPSGRQEERFVTTLQTMFEDFYLHLNRQINEQKKAA